MYIIRMWYVKCSMVWESDICSHFVMNWFCLESCFSVTFLSPPVATTPPSLSDRGHVVHSGLINTVIAICWLLPSFCKGLNYSHGHLYPAPVAHLAISISVLPILQCMGLALNLIFFVLKNWNRVFYSKSIWHACTSTDPWTRSASVCWWCALLPGGKKKSSLTIAVLLFSKEAPWQKRWLRTALGCQLVLCSPVSTSWKYKQGLFSYHAHFTKPEWVCPAFVAVVLMW